MKRSAVLMGLMASLLFGTGTAIAACDPALLYFAVKAAVFQKEPSSETDFAELMSSIGLAQDEHVWKCDAADGASMAAVYMPSKRWVTMTYTPPRTDKIPEAVLTTLAKLGRAEVVGPRVIRYYFRSDQAALAALGSSAEVEEYITVTLSGGEHEETGCTIKLGAKAKR